MLHCRFDTLTITVQENGTLGEQGEAVGEWTNGFVVRGARQDSDSAYSAARLLTRDEARRIRGEYRQAAGYPTMSAFDT